MRYINKQSELVDAWQIDVEELRYQGEYPDWIGNLIGSGKLMLTAYPKTAELQVSPQGRVIAKHGDYIMKSSIGTYWTCIEKHFDENYEEWNGDYEYDTGRPIRSEKLTTKDFIIESIEDHDDGSCTIHMDMDIETLKIFASIGIKQVLLDEAKKVLKENDP